MFIALFSATPRENRSHLDNLTFSLSYALDLRPYRTALSHANAVNIMTIMADRGKIDAGIVSDISEVFN